MSKIVLLVGILLLLTIITIIIPSSNNFLGEWKKTLLLYIFKKVKYIIVPSLIIVGVIVWSLVNSYNYNKKGTNKVEF